MTAHFISLFLALIPIVLAARNPNFFSNINHYLSDSQNRLQLTSSGQEVGEGRGERRSGRYGSAVSLINN